MAARNTTLKDEIESYNEQLDCQLRGQYGMTLKAFKTIKAITQLVGAGAGIYAMSLGAPPLATFALVAIIVSGPEALEYLINDP